MNKIYPVMPQIEVNNYDTDESIDMVGLPESIRKEMEKVAKIHKCDIKELEYKRHTYYEDYRWVDMGEVIYKG